MAVCIFMRTNTHMRRILLSLFALGLYPPLCPSVSPNPHYTAHMNGEWKSRIMLRLWIKVSRGCARECAMCIYSLTATAICLKSTSGSWHFCGFAKENGNMQPNRISYREGFLQFFSAKVFRISLMRSSFLCLRYSPSLCSFCIRFDDVALRIQTVWCSFLVWHAIMVARVFFTYPYVICVCCMLVITTWHRQAMDRLANLPATERMNLKVSIKTVMMTWFIFSQRRIHSILVPSLSLAPCSSEYMYHRAFSSYYFFFRHYVFK